VWLSVAVLSGCRGELVRGPSAAAGSQAAAGQGQVDPGGQGGSGDGSVHGDSRGGTDSPGGSGQEAGADFADGGAESGNATGGKRTGGAGQTGRGNTGGDAAEGGRASGGASGDRGTGGTAAGGGTDELTGGTAGTGGRLLTGGTGDTGGRPPTGGTTTTGGSLATGGSSHTGGAATGGAATGGTAAGGSAGGGSGGAATGGSATGGSGGAGGGGACTGTETRGSCPANREVCSNGAWVPDLSCYSEACDLVTCPDNGSDCCMGWGRVGIDCYDYTPSEGIVTSFSLEQGSEEYFYASFQFEYWCDIGAITLYFSEPIAWGAITAVEVDVLFDGDPSPTLEISLEDGVANRGCIWTPLHVSGRTLITPADMYQPPLGCFAGNGCPEGGDLIDRMNVRLRPYDMDAYSSGEAELTLYAVRVYTD
jgi:hypothetical protein